MINNNTMSSDHSMCFCLDPIDEANGDVLTKLQCGCIGHLPCVLRWIRIALNDRSKISELGVICPWVNQCPHHCTNGEKLDHFISCEQLRKLQLKSSTHSKHLIDNACAPLSSEEVQKFQRFTDDKFQVEDNEDEDSETECSEFIKAMTKPCPNCNLCTTHYHGHGCHHIAPSKGCINCNIHYCYRCLSTETQNKEKRGSSSNCICGSWSMFCSTDDIIGNI